MKIKTFYACGDSFTFGQEIGGDSPPGLFYTQTDHQKVSNYVGQLGAHYEIPHVINTALPGCSNDRIFRKVMGDVSEILTRIPAEELFVHVAFTEASRREFFHSSKNSYHMYLNNHKPNGSEYQAIWNAYTAYFDDPIENRIRYLTQVISLQNFLKHHNVKYLFTDSLRVPDVHDLSKNTSFQDGGMMHDWTGVIKALSDQIDRIRYPKDSIFNDWSHRQGHTYGPHGHPLEHGHKEWAQYLIRYIDEKQLLQG